MVKSKEKRERCVCGSFDNEMVGLCKTCYRKMNRQCSRCTHLITIINPNDFAINEECELEKIGKDMRKRAECIEFNVTTDKLIEKKIFRLIDVYNKRKELYTHYVQLDGQIIVVFEFKSSWSYHFYKLEHFIYHSIKLNNIK